MSYELSICIPAAPGEKFLRRTVEDCLEHKEGATEIIVVMDGGFADPGLDVHEDVTVIYNDAAVGQRAATNQAARVSEAKWVMKLDAHCAWDQGFDVKLMAAIDGHDDWTLIPKMFNLHAFDWVCNKCGHVRYQGPSQAGCPMLAHTGCDGVEEVVMRWKPRRGTENTAMRFDRQLKFAYWGEYKARQKWDVPGEKDCADTLSLLGACWMLTRERYHALNFSDEGHGSWGQQGTEVACKSWLSGGQLKCYRGTWFAHMFRTQGGDFGFPVEITGSQVEAARQYSRNLWLGNNWEHAIHPLSWLIDKFAPVPDWSKSRGIVYYTSHTAPLKISRQVQKLIRSEHLPITSASLKPIPKMGRNIVIDAKPSIPTMFRQILAALEAANEDVIFFCEHDVLYHPTHFEFLPSRDDRFYYNTNVYKVRLEDGYAYRVDDCRQTSGLCASRELLLEHYRKRVEIVERDGFTRRMGFEPGTHRRAERVDDHKSERWESEFPNVDIRLPGALTSSRWSPSEFRDQKFAAGWVDATIETIPGWNGLKVLLTG